MASLPERVVEELVAAARSAVEAPAYLREEALFELDKALESAKFAEAELRAMETY